MADISRRAVLKAAGGMAMAASPLGAWAAEVASTQQGGRGKRILLFTKSQGYPHAVVTRKPGEPLALAERLLSQWGSAAGFEVVVSKDGSLFSKEYVAGFDAFVFYTSGDLTKPPATAKSDQTPAMTAEGKAALLAAIAAGKGFVGLHSASDTFQDTSRKADPVRVTKEGVVVDPYCRMLGAEFTSHAKQQSAKIRVVGEALKKVPGMAGLTDFEITEEWYGFTNLSPDLHVMLVQETASMAVDAKTGLRDVQYRGEPYPETWARMEGKGRVFYTGMGHREDVWGSERYKQIVMGGIAWTSGTAGEDVVGNLKTACPGVLNG